MNGLHAHTSCKQFSNSVDIVIPELVDIIQNILGRHGIKFLMVKMVYTGLQGADTFEQALLQVGADTHDLAGRLHLSAQGVGCGSELIEGETGQLGDHIVQLGLKGSIGVGDLDLFQGHAHCDLCSHSCNGIAGSLRCQCGRAGHTGIDLDQVVLAAVGIERKLHIAAALDLQFPDDLDGRIVQHLPIVVIQGHNGRHNQAVTGMDANRVDVFHAADGDGMVVAVAHDLELDLLIALDGLLDQHLVHGRELECVEADFNQFLFVVCKATAGTAEGKCRTQHHGITNTVGSFLGLFNGVGDLGGNNRLTNGLAQLLEQLSVLSSLNGFTAGTQQLHTALFQDTLLLQLHSQIQTGLSADAGNDGIRALVANDLGNVFQGQRLHVDLVGNHRIGHDRSRVGVAQHDLIALFPQRQACLGACIVKFGGLSNDDGTRADDQNFLNVRSLCHDKVPPASFSVSDVAVANGQ